MKAKQSLSYGTWEILVFIIIVSAAPPLLGAPLSSPGLGLVGPASVSPSIIGFMNLDSMYFSFALTALGMLIFVYKVIVFDFAANIEQGIETSYLMLPVRRSRLLVPVVLAGMILPYCIASATLYYALYLGQFHYTSIDALYMLLLNFLPLMFICAISLLAAMTTRSSLVTLSVALLTSFLLVILVGFTPEFAAKAHSMLPYYLLGLIFPAGSAYTYYNSLGLSYPGPTIQYGASLASFYSALPWMALGAAIIDTALMALVFWYWGHRFQITA